MSSPNHTQLAVFPRWCSGRRLGRCDHGVFVGVPRELISDGVDNAPELETETLQTLIKLTEILCRCKSYSDDRVG